MKLLKNNVSTHIPYPFRFIFKYRREVLNSKEVFFKLTNYYLRRIFNLSKTFKSSNVLLLYSHMRIKLPVDSLCEMDVIYKEGIYDKSWKVSKNSVVIDVGAHVGMFALKMAKEAKTVIAIEPNSNNFNLLTENINSNGFENIIPLHLAVSDNVGEKTLYFNKSSLGYSIVEDGMAHEKVKTNTLDNLVKTFGANFIKINAEGAETKILNGGELCLKSSTITLAISTHSNILKEEVIKILRSCNFTVTEGKFNILHAGREEQI